MLFTLEALHAKHGDCLLLHFGKESAPSIMVIDGGPSGIYKGFLKPRLLEIKETLSPDAPLPLSMVMVSHLDDDHLNGILSLTEDAIEDNQESFGISNLWFNTFDDIIGNVQFPGVASTASVSASSIRTPSYFEGVNDHATAVIASTGQGRELRNNAKKLAATVNNPFEPIKTGQAALVRGDAGMPGIDWDGLSIQVIHPNGERLQELQEKWDKDLKQAKKAGDKSIIVAMLNDVDTSPFNLSSIVCLVTYKKKTILLTGDARSDDIYAGLKTQKLLDKNGKLHVNLLKMPHHGSQRNLSDEFVEKITADNYVISADGNFDNPDDPTIEKIAEVNKKNSTVTLYLTNHDGKKGIKKRLDKILARLKKEKNKMKIVFRDLEEPSIHINLLDKLEY